MILQSCQTRIYPLLSQPSSEHGHNQNYAALILTGMVFSGFVLIYDVCALYHVYFKDDLKLLEDIYGVDAYIFSRITIAVILSFDGLTMLFSGLNFFIISCLTQDCMRCCFSCFIFMYFCRKHTYSENEFDKHQEYRLWLLLASFIAPLVCMGTHSSFVIMAWTSDSEQANSMTVIFILSFIYYFLGFRQLYIIFAQGCCVTYTPKKPSSITYDSLRLEELSDSESYVDVKISGGSSAQCCCLTFNNQELDTEIEIHCKKLKHFNLKALICEFVFILPLLMSVEALVILVYYFLPVPVITVPANILSIFHLTLLIGTGLIAYKFLKANVPKSGSSEDQRKIGKALKQVVNQSETENPA